MKNIQEKMYAEYLNGTIIKDLNFMFTELKIKNYRNL